MSQRNPQREMIAVVRVKTKTDWMTYFETISMALLFIDATIIVLLSLASLLLLPLESPKFFIKAQSFYVNGVVAIILFLILAIIETRRQIRQLKGLWSLHHAQRNPSTKVSWQTFLHISLPLWLTVEEVLHDPSPTNVLDRVQGPALTTGDLAELCLHNQEPESEEKAPIDFLISLTNEVSISAKGEDGKQESTVLKNLNRAAIVAFLARLKKGEWIPRDVVVKLVYGTVKKATLDRFNVDKDRMNTQILEMVESAGIFLDGEKAKEQIRLLEHSSIDGIPHWRLNPRYEVEICGQLTALHQAIMNVASDQPATEPSLETLRTSCDYLMQTSGKGFLADYQDVKHIWPWIEEDYIHYRDQCLDILAYAAQRFFAHARSAPSPQKEQEAFKYAVSLLRKSVLVASGLIPDEARSVEVLRQCLAHYRQFKNISAARSLFQSYAERMRERDASWVPDNRILQPWPEATAEWEDM
ncbi:MAG TPA: hypothetical protein VFB60_11340 [Ktedonobacteraceae bacterium]|nr:hypothetical protein [Ktedonobacteraceae bacterium]